ncbi:i-spanin [Pararheinheimera phage vB_PsoM_KLER1-1]|nr:i-spanin [Pararheinheimera phage vB_PsoM_KLER1-1]
MSNVYGKLIGVTFLLVCSAWAGHEWSDRSWQVKWSDRDTAEATARADAVEAAVKKRNERITELEKANNETKQRLTDEILAKRAADDAANSLQQRIKDILRRAGNNTGTTTAERAAAATDITVLANMLGRLDRAAGELAEVAGQRYVAGLDCQRRYQIEFNKKAAN